MSNNIFDRVSGELGEQPVKPQPVATERDLTAQPPIESLLQVTPLRGRDADLQQVSTLLSSSPVFLTGTAGSGKSRLAADLAMKRPNLSGAVWYRAGAYPRVGDLLALLRVHLGGKPTDPTRLLLTQLRETRTLIVIDNADAITDPDDHAAFIRLVRDLHATGTRILLTAREPWKGLTNSTTFELPPLSSEAAAQFARDRAELADQLEAIEPHIEELVTVTEGHPRLIEWSMGCLIPLSPLQLLEDLHMLPDGSADEKLAAWIRLTFQQMLNIEGVTIANTLKKLHVCPETFEQRAALAVTGLDNDILSYLLERLSIWQFLRRVGDRYYILPDVCAAIGTDHDARQAHADHYFMLTYQDEQTRAYADLLPDNADLEAALQYTLEKGDIKAAYWLVNENGYGDFLVEQGRADLFIDWLERVAAAVPTDAPGKPYSALQIHLGDVFRETRSDSPGFTLRQAVACYERALEHIASEPNNGQTSHAHIGIAVANRLLAQVEDPTPPLQAAITAYENALKHIDAQTESTLYATTAHSLGNVYMDFAQFQARETNLNAAIAAYKDALNHRNFEQDGAGYAATQNNLGNAYAELAQIMERKARLQSVLAAVEGMVGNENSDDGSSEPIKIRQQHLHQALDAYNEALRYYSAEQTPIDYAMTQNNLGSAYRKLAELEDKSINLQKAVEAYETALRFHSLAAMPYDHAMTQRNLGIARYYLGDKEGALDCWQTAAAAYRQADATYKADAMERWIKQETRGL